MVMPNDRADVADAPTRRQGVAEQLGFTSAELLRALPGAVIAAGLAFVGAVFFANRVGLQGAAGLGFVVACTGVGFAAGLLVLRTVVHGTAAGIAATVLPSGASTAATDDYSREDALLMQRDVEGALESFEAKIADDPRLVGARLRAADLYAGAGGDPVAPSASIGKCSASLGWRRPMPSTRRTGSSTSTTACSPTPGARSSSCAG